MFNYDPHSEDITVLKEEYVPEVLGDVSTTLDPSQLVHTAITKDMNLDQTLTQVETAEKIIDEEKRMIQAVKEDTKQKIKRRDLAGPSHSQEPRETADGLELTVRSGSDRSSDSGEEDSEEEEKPHKQISKFFAELIMFVRRESGNQRPDFKRINRNL